MKLTSLRVVAFASTLVLSSLVASTQHVTAVARSYQGSPFVGDINAMTATERLNAGDQGMLRFTAIEGIKPIVTITRPAYGEFSIYEMGTKLPSGRVVGAKTAESIAKMTPMRWKGFFDYVKQVDFKYKGFRQSEAPLAAVVEDFMSLIGAIQPKDYQGVFMKAEYESGMPMVFTLQNVKQLRALQEYFEQNITQPRDQKSWLVLEISQTPDELTQADVAFWSQYFEIKRVADHEVYKFIRDEHDTQHDIAAIGCKGEWMMHKPGEVVLLELEKAFAKFKTPDLMLMAAVYLIGNYGTKPFLASLKLDNDTTSTIITGIKYAALAAAIYAVYRLYVNSRVDDASDMVDADEEAEVVAEQPANAAVEVAA